MTDRRNPERKLLHEARVRQEKLEVERRENERLRAVLADAQALEITVRLAGRLRRREDFDLFIGMGRVLDADGRIDARKLELQVVDLLRRRPELASEVPTVS
jgi:hypothetical protein